MPPRAQHDPFTDAPLRPTTSNTTALSSHPSLRSQTSQHSLRSNASTASSRPRQQQGLFAPNLSRRPNSRATPRIDSDGVADVYADVDSEADLTVDLTGDLRQRQMRKVRHGSPEGKTGRLNLKTKAEEDAGMDFVNRRPDGSFLLGVAGYGETVAVPYGPLPKSAEEIEQDEIDATHLAIAKHYFSKETRTTKAQQEELEKVYPAMMLRLREQVTQQLEDEKWMYEPVNNHNVGML